MSKDLNKVQFTGRLGADPEMRFTPQGSTVTTFRVASNRTWKSADGQVHEDTEWFSVVSWNKLAEICNSYLSKGTRVYVEGRLQTRSWDDAQTGDRRYKTEVVANDMIILTGRRESSGDGRPADEWSGDDQAPAAEENTDRSQAAAPARNSRNDSSRASAGSRKGAGSSQAQDRDKMLLEEEDLPF